MDKKIKCLDCNNEFAFSESEQKFYKNNNFAEPKRCKSCREVRKAEYKKGGKRNGK